MATKENKKTSIWTCKIIAIFFVGTFLLRSIFTAVYFKQIGLSSTYTGILQGASPIANAIGGIILGYIADRADLRKIIFTCSYLAYAVTPLLVSLPHPIYQCKNLTKNNSSNFRDFNNMSSTINGSQLQAFQHLVKNNVPNLQGLDNAEKRTRDYSSLEEEKKSARFSNNWTSSIQQFGHTKYEHFPNSSNLIPGNNLAPTKTKSPHQSTNYEDKLFAILLAITIFADFLAGASINLADTLVVHTIDDKKEYGKVRLWGNIGQAVTIPSIAVLTYFTRVDICGASVSDFKYALYSASLISSIGWLITIFKAHFPSSKVEEGDVKHGNGVRDLKELITPLETWSLLIISFFYGAANTTMSSFLFWTMVDLNASQANLSIAVANFIRNAASLVLFLVAPKLLHAVGYRNVLSISFLIYATAFVVMSVMRSSWLGTLVELFIGSAYALSMSACVSYIGEVAQPALAVTAQGLLHFMYTGIGAAAGPSVAGIIMDHTGQTITFLIFAAMCILLMIFSIIVHCVLKVRQGDYQQLGRNEEKESEPSAEIQR